MVVFVVFYLLAMFIYKFTEGKLLSGWASDSGWGVAGASCGPGGGSSEGQPVSAMKLFSSLSLAK